MRKGLCRARGIFGGGADGAGHLQNGASFTQLADLNDEQWADMREAIRRQDEADKARGRE